MARNHMNHPEKARRVVITGMGIVAPNGCGLAPFWQSIVLGQSAAAKIRRFDTSSVPTKVGCELKDFDAKKYMEAKMTRRYDLSIQYGIAASRMAADDAGIKLASMDPDRLGIVEGTSVSGMESSFKGQITYLTKGYNHMSPFTLINAYTGGGSGEIAMELGIKGHAVSYCSGSASGNDAIGHAYSMILEDDVDVMVAGGAEAPILAPLWGAFCQTKVMTLRNDEPLGAMRPLDKTRDGFLLGEGAGFLVLEELSHALARDAKIYAEVAGHGRSCEAYHSVSPHPDGIGMKRAMEKALRAARMLPSEIDYINIHGTATTANDIVEMRAIKSVFNGHSKSVAISSTKPVTGHTLAAAGAIESVVCALAIHNGEIPFTLNLTTPEDECAGNLVTGRSRLYPLNAVMNLSCGFGGKNSCLILKRHSGRP
jgi:3-oxoacyl-[acyl-carrier-protein] synthase II